MKPASVIRGPYYYAYDWFHSILLLLFVVLLAVVMVTTLQTALFLNIS